MRRNVVLSIVGGSVIAAVVLVNIVQLAQVYGTCSISWSANSPTCDVADTTSGDFGYQVTTITQSYQNGNWVLCQAIAIYDNIASASVSPSSYTVVERGGLGSENITTTCSGLLDNPTAQGLSDLNAWDSSQWNCADSFGTTIKPYGQSCN